MKKADGWSMGQEEQKKKALEEKLRRRAYTAAFEAAQQRKEKPWQSWDEAFSERLAKQPFITEEERKPFAPSGAGAQKRLFTQGKSSRGRAWGKRGRGRRAGQREPLGRRCRRTRRPARGPCFWRGSAGAWRRPRRAGSRLPGRSRARPALRLRGRGPGVPRRGVCGAGAGGAAAARAAEGGHGDRQSIAARRGIWYTEKNGRKYGKAWWDAFLEQQAALQAQTLAQERAQAEGVGAAYTKYVRPLLERAALGLSTAFVPHSQRSRQRAGNRACAGD